MLAENPKPGLEVGPQQCCWERRRMGRREGLRFASSPPHLLAHQAAILPCSPALHRTPWPGRCQRWAYQRAASTLRTSLTWLNRL